MHVTLEVSGHMPLLALPWSSSWPNASHTRHEPQSSSSYPKWKTCTCGRCSKSRVSTRRVEAIISSKRVSAWWPAGSPSKKSLPPIERYTASAFVASTAFTSASG